MFPSHRVAVLAVAISCVSAVADDHVPVAAQKSGPASVRRLPWEWSDSERMAERLDQESAKRRIEADLTEGERRPRIRTNVAAARERVDVIAGKRDPHLFFEWELFDHVVFAAYSYSRHPRAWLIYREMYEPGRKQAGLPDDFWLHLEAITAAHRATRAEERRLGTSGGAPEERQANSLELCRTRYEALSEAKAAFGPAFTRFLYTVVAPQVSHTVFVKSSDDTELRIARGVCQ